MTEKINRRFTNGPLFSDWAGKVTTTEALYKLLAEVLEEIFNKRKELFQPQMKDKDEIAECYQVYRSIRRSSDSRALLIAEQKANESDIDIVDCWQKIKKAQGNQPALQMEN